MFAVSVATIAISEDTHRRLLASEVAQRRSVAVEEPVQDGIVLALSSTYLMP
jgi:hypothetical protein